ncbi:hypothetical protein WR25_07220 [Diploscapter pachys]|uniref:Uncharacterized protein n=1 Tax=Diploscapter pachys TaxID=2018661 RepID=A0A2A2J2L2_9BILA|nr:hypothetical protein WR25_07220 [Diploscapter pachys]
MIGGLEIFLERKTNDLEKIACPSLICNAIYMAEIKHCCCKDRICMQIERNEEMTSRNQNRRTFDFLWSSGDLGILKDWENPMKDEDELGRKEGYEKRGHKRLLTLNRSQLPFGNTFSCLKGRSHKDHSHSIWTGFSERT